MKFTHRSRFLGLRGLTGLFGAVLLATGAAQAEVVIIANKAGPDSLTKEQVADLYMGRVGSLPTGGAVALQDQPESSPLRDEFYTKVTGKSAAQAKSYWAKMAFSGKGIPPKENPGSPDVKKAVAATPGAIGYIEKSAVDGSVKAVLTVN